MALRTDYKDALFEALRRYQIIHNEDGTISLLDVTRYTQTGDKFGSNDVNAITEKINNNENKIKDAEGNIINLQKEKANKTEVDDLLKGKSNTNHTHNYAGSDSAGGKANSAKVADSVAWGNVSGKPSSYPPSGHNHDDRYYTETEMNTLLNNKSNTNHAHAYAGSDSAGGKATSAKVADSVAWGNVSGKPTGYPPSSHNHDDRYYTETEMNTKLNGKSDTTHHHDSVYSKATNVKNGTGNYAVAEGAGNTASGYYAHAEGSNAKATADCAHAEGFKTIASHLYTHAEGSETTASSNNAHAEGLETVASAPCSHAENYHTIAKGHCSHAAGDNTIAAGRCSFAIGTYNKDPAGSINAMNSPFMIGKGSDDANRANIFRVYYTGTVYSTGAYNTTGADYAEYFEWLDKNTSDEDRVGYFVTLDGEKIRIATEEEDYILGIVSATPSIIGNSYDDQWIGREIRDEWGRIIYEEVEIEEEREEEGNILQEARKEMQPKLNKDYDNSKEYIGRSQRKEWSAVGMLGQLLVRDDGTCQVNSYCQCGKEGVATASETGYRVLARVSNNIIKVLFR